MKIKPKEDGTFNITLDWHILNEHPYEEALKIIDAKLKGASTCSVSGCRVCGKEL